MKSSHLLSKYNWTKKFLLYEIIPQAGFNLTTGRFWPAGRMFDTPALCCWKSCVRVFVRWWRIRCSTVCCGALHYVPDVFSYIHQRQSA